MKKKNSKKNAEGENAKDTRLAVEIRTMRAGRASICDGSKSGSVESVLQTCCGGGHGGNTTHGGDP